MNKPLLGGALFFGSAMLASMRYRLYFSDILVCVALALCAMGLYWPALAGGYVWDDADLFVNSPQLRQVGSIEEWLKAVSAPVLPATTYFRPMVLSTFVLEFMIFGILPSAAHGINLVIFACNVNLVFLLARRLLEGEVANLGHSALLAGVAAVIYLVHPAQIESVAWVAGRFDLLVTFFSLLTVLSLWAPGLVGICLVSVFCLLALLSKEMAITLVLIVPLLAWGLKGSNRPHQSVWHALGAIFVAIFIYGAAKLAAMGVLSHTDLGLAHALNMPQRLGFVGLTLLFYMKMALFPFLDISPQHPFDATAMSYGQVTIGIFVLLVTAGISVYALRKVRKFSLFWVVSMLSLMPILNIVILTIGGTIGCDRFLSLPLVFFVIFLVLAAAASHIRSPSQTLTRVFLGATLIWVLIAVLNVVVTVPLWRNDLTLWTWSYQKHPDDGRTQMNLASAYFKVGEMARLRSMLDGAVQRGGDPHRFDVIYGAIDIKTGREADGIAKIERVFSGVSLPHKPLLKSGYNLDEVHADMRWYPNGSRVTFAYMALADGYRGLRRFGDALEAAQIARFYMPKFSPAILAEALAYYGLGQTEKGDGAYNLALSLFTVQGQLDAAKVRSEFFARYCGERIEISPHCAKE
jgi:hypothetical protein